ncbi:MAG: PQQ-dependent sugar dehydrogenase, partial [Verrucomicrobiota bacterium]
MSCCFAAFAFAEERVAWTTSNVIGSDEPPRPYVSEPLWPHITFNKALDIATSPALEEIFVVEQKGKIWSLPARIDANPSEAMLVADLSEIVKPQLESVLGMCIHPNFATNREVFFFYRTSVGTDDGSRISRFKLRQTGQQLKVDPLTEEIIIQFGAGGHNGGHLGFGPDGML